MSFAIRNQLNCSFGAEKSTPVLFTHSAKIYNRKLATQTGQMGKTHGEPPSQLHPR
jgi:hypothetical protein